MIVDKFGQVINVGDFIIKPWGGCFDVGRVIKVTEHTFTYEYKGEGWHAGKTLTSVCKVPERCLVVPPIVANYWSVLDGW